MGKKENLAGRLKQARILQNAEEDARREGKEKLEEADQLASQRIRLMQTIKTKIQSGLATTGVPVIDEEIIWLNDETLEPPPPESQREFPEGFFGQ